MKRLLCCLLAAALLAFTGCTAKSSGTVGLIVGEESGSAAPTADTDAASPAPVGSATSAGPAMPTPAPVSEDWTPSQKVTMIVSYKAGSSTDVGARLFATFAEKAIGQSIEIKNISANSGMTGWETLAAASPDGYTLGFINMPNIFTAIENGGNFTTQSFAPICSHVVETSVVVVAESSPYQTLADLIAANQAASAAGTPLRAATNGVQASNDIGAALLAYSTGGWGFKHVSYGSTKDQLSALLSGECNWSVAKVSDVLNMVETTDASALPEAEADAAAPSAEPQPTVQPTARPEAEAAGEAAPEGSEEVAPADTRVRVLAVFDTERCAELPEVPSMTELGYPTGWYGSTRAVVAPAGTDPIIINYYAEAFRQAMSTPECIAAHQEAGLQLQYMDPTTLSNRIDERERFNHSLLPKLFGG